jgi:hypothetical protein
VQGYLKANAGQGFVDSISFCVSHELTEAISDPDGQGYSSKANGYEIADICEPAAIGEVIITQNLRRSSHGTLSAELRASQSH